VNIVVVAERNLANQNYQERLKTRKQVARQPKKQTKKGHMVLTVIAIAIVVFFVMTRFSLLAENQYKIVQLQNELKVLEEENELLKVKVAKLKSVSRIENIAKQKLNMVEPNNHQIVYLDHN
jgi:cell division protein FtsL